MNYFGQVLMENNLLKSYFENLEIKILFPFLEISHRRKLTFKNHVFFKIDLKYVYQQRDATTGYCEILNMKLNIWFDIPSKYIEDFCIIASVAVVSFSERLTDTSFLYFFLRLLPFF